MPRRFRYRLLSWSSGVDVNKIYDPDRLDYIEFKAHVSRRQNWLLYREGITAIYSNISALFLVSVKFYGFGGFLFQTRVQRCELFRLFQDTLFIFAPVKVISPMEQAVKLLHKLNTIYNPVLGR